MEASDIYKRCIIRMYNSLINIRLILLFLSFFFLQPLMAQDKTQYLLHKIPQTLSLNPAITFNCKNYFEVPFISQLQLYYRNSGFSHMQAFNDREGITNDTTRLDLNRLAKVVGNRNHIRLGGKISLLGFGFEANDWFFSMNVSNRSTVRLSFNRDIIDARDGNWDLSTNQPRDIIINGTGVHLSNFTEFAFGASHEIFQGFSAGIRAKYLSGSAHLQTRRSNIRIITAESPVEIKVSSDLLARGSLPVNLELSNDGQIRSIDTQFNSISDLPGLLLSFNHGLAFDAGVLYAYSDKLVLSASILDLGFIRWRKNINVISQKEEFVFQGIDLNNYLQSEDDTDFLQALGDSINSRFRLSVTNSPYTALLPFRLFAGAEYKWRQKISIGTVIEGEVLSNRIYPSLTFTAISRPSDVFTVSLSYSLMDRGFDNFGFGIILGNSPLMFYLVSDNIPVNYVRETSSGIIWPYRARTMNFRAGLNIIPGCRDKKKYFRSRKWRHSCPAYN